MRIASTMRTANMFKIFHRTQCQKVNLDIYYKITNERECHNGYQYKTGPNVLSTEFAEAGSCVPGGLYFSNKENIHHFYNRGIYTRSTITYIRSNF